MKWIHTTIKYAGNLAATVPSRPSPLQENKYNELGPNQGRFLQPLNYSMNNLLLCMQPGTLCLTGTSAHLLLLT